MIIDRSSFCDPAASDSAQSVSGAGGGRVLPKLSPSRDAVVGPRFPPCDAVWPCKRQNPQPRPNLQNDRKSSRKNVGQASTACVLQGGPVIHKNLFFFFFFASFPQWDICSVAEDFQVDDGFWFGVFLSDIRPASAASALLCWPQWFQHLFYGSRAFRACREVAGHPDGDQVAADPWMPPAF